MLNLVPPLLPRARHPALKQPLPPTGCWCVGAWWVSRALPWCRHQPGTGTGLPGMDTTRPQVGV